MSVRALTACAMCGKEGATLPSDDELCEGCLFCNPECEQRYIEFLADDLGRHDPEPEPEGD